MNMAWHKLIITYHQL